jgi:hypothetical protein
MFRQLIICVSLLALLHAGPVAAQVSGGSRNLEALPRPGELVPAPSPPALKQPQAPPVPPVQVPVLNKGAMNPRTGEFYPPQGEGIINPRTGEYYPPIRGEGYINPKTGEFYPRK